MTLRLTHTLCGQAVHFTDDNRILSPDSDAAHTCPVTAGPYYVIRWGSSWSIEDVLDTHRKQPRYPTQADAQAEADKRNRAYHQARAPKPPAPIQHDLFSSQEAT